jgi:ribulose-5-phosphate 4-epimerase/fuculose-1-phosphate aldolase
VPTRLQEGDIFMVRGHGPFAVGHLTAEACRLTSLLETRCRIMTVAGGSREQTGERREGPDRRETR